MNEIDELVYYCGIDNPVGALMLTGEWGCGKTYLIEHSLKDKIGKNSVILRVSLFGLSSVEEVRRTVKDLWFKSKDGFFAKTKKVDPDGHVKDLLKRINDLTPHDATQKFIGGILSIDITDFFDITNRIDGKKVILVFDDMERSNIPVGDLLGVINEYCENKHFSVIIVSNESKLEENDRYNELKEKVVQRTIRCEPDYESVVASIINETPKSSYKSFLEEKRDAISTLFAGMDYDGSSLNEKSRMKMNYSLAIYGISKDDERSRLETMIKNRPHNIRSLKSSIQDFKRVYDLLVEYKAPDNELWLYSFLSLAMAKRANLIKSGDESKQIYHLTDLGVLYPGYFDASHMPDVIYNWIVNGVWKENVIRQYFEKQYRVSSDSPAKEQIKYRRIDYLEDNIAINGMKEVMQEAYEGNLSLGEYEYIIMNSRLSRYYGLEKYGVYVDWSNMYVGIEKRIENIYKEGIEDDTFGDIIGGFSDYSDEELKAYEMIRNAHWNSAPMYEANKREFIENMKMDSIECFRRIYGKKFRCFDKEMADAIIEGFLTTDNMSKIQFPSYFEGMWERIIKPSFDKGDGIDESLSGLRSLKEGLEVLDKKEYNQQPIKKILTEKFIEKVDKMICEESLQQ